MTYETEGRSSADIAREAEERRADLGRTLDELRRKMTPGEIVDEIWSVAKGSGGGDFVRNLGRGVRDNPLPVALIGAGMAWLMTGRGGGTRITTVRASDEAYDFERYQGPRRRFTAASQYQNETDDSYSTPYTSEEFYAPGEAEKEDEEGDRKRAEWGFKHAPRDAANAVRDAGERLAETGSRAASAVSDAASSVGEQASSLGHETAQRARHLSRSAYRSGSRASAAARDFVEEQPLVAAAIGLALGALLGAAIRPTRLEEDLMGEASESFKRQTSDLAREGYERAATAVSNTMDEVVDEAREQGLTTEDASRAAGDLQDRVRSVYERGKEAFREELTPDEPPAEPR